MGRDEHADHIYRRAYELAASGLHLEPITIVATLIREGYPEADKILDNPLLRADLRLVCSRNWPGTHATRGQELRVKPAREQDNLADAPTLRKFHRRKH